MIKVLRQIKNPIILQYEILNTTAIKKKKNCNHILKPLDNNRKT